MIHVPSTPDSTSDSWFHETVLEPHPSLASFQKNVVSPCQWLSTETAFADSGGLVTGDELAELLRTQCQLDGVLHASPPLSMVARWLTFNKVVSIASPWGPMLPLFQFDLARAAIHPGVQLALCELRGVLNDVELALWFVTPNEWLEGAKPVQALRNKIGSVQRAARTDRYVALGG